MLRFLPTNFLTPTRVFAAAGLLLLFTGALHLSSTPSTEKIEHPPLYSDLSFQLIPPSTDRPSELVHQISYVFLYNERLDDVLLRSGLHAADRQVIFQTLQTHQALMIRPGTELRLHRAADKTLAFALIFEDEHLFFLRQTDGRFMPDQQLTATPERHLAQIDLRIRHDLFRELEQHSLPERLIQQLTEALEWRLDLLQGLQRGDRIQLLYEMETLDRIHTGRGQLLALRVHSQEEWIERFYFTDAQGQSAFYDPQGLSEKVQFLRSPVAYRYISSGFKTERWHPILGQKRPHRGVDFAAAMGTPVRATATGRVIEKGSLGGYGNTIILEHPGEITTLYAHLNDYASGLKLGQTVEQGTIIGYVGMTGLATGPHLHYEYRIRGQHQDPMQVVSRASQSLSLQDQQRFRQQVLQQRQQMLEPQNLAHHSKEASSHLNNDFSL